MPIYPDREQPYRCAICGRDCPRQWESPQMQSRAPLCWMCEQEWGTGAYGDCNPDRRKIKQISALTRCLSVTAHCIDVGCEEPYARA